MQDLKSEERGRVLTPQMKVGQCAKESLFNRSPLLEFQILEENEHIWGERKDRRKTSTTQAFAQSMNIPRSTHSEQRKGDDVLSMRRLSGSQAVPELEVRESGPATTRESSGPAVRGLCIFSLAGMMQFSRSLAAKNAGRGVRMPKVRGRV